MNYSNYINSEGFAIINDIYSDVEIEKIISEIEKVTQATINNSTFRKSQRNPKNSFLYFQ
jgi:hypothetical protein